MHEHGYELGNLDATIILQRPKLSPHKETIRANLCRLLGADLSVINLKVSQSAWGRLLKVCQLVLKMLPWWLRRPRRTRRSTAWGRTGASQCMLCAC
jgi:hypothetical protein